MAASAGLPQTDPVTSHSDQYALEDGFEETKEVTEIEFAT